METRFIIELMFASSWLLSGMFVTYLMIKTDINNAEKNKQAQKTFWLKGKKDKYFSVIFFSILGYASLLAMGIVVLCDLARSLEDTE